MSLRSKIMGRIPQAPGHVRTLWSKRWIKYATGFVVLMAAYHGGVDDGQAQHTGTPDDSQTVFEVPLYCPTEDSCTTKNVDGRLYVFEVTP